VYLRVPEIRVRTDEHWVTVHVGLVPLRSAAAETAVIGAQGTATVTVQIPVAGPSTTITSTVTSTEIIPTTVTSTITLPLESGGPVS